MKLPRFIRKAIYGEVGGITVGDVVKDGYVAQHAGDGNHGDVIALAYDLRQARPVLRPVVQWHGAGTIDHHKGRLLQVRRGEKSINQARAEFGLPPLTA